MDRHAKIVDGYLVKMDAVSLDGVWLNFPQAAGLGKLTWAAFLYQKLDRERPQRPDERPEARRRQLVQEIEARIARDDEDDLFVMTL